MAFFVLNLPLDKVDSLDQNSLLSLMDEVMYIPIFVYDKTTEGIFSDDIETWKNMGNFQFIDNVGKCFSNMHTTYLCRKRQIKKKKVVGNG